MGVASIAGQWKDTKKGDPSGEEPPYLSVCAPCLLLVQLSFLREHGRITVGQGKDHSGIREHQSTASPFHPVGVVGLPFVEGHDGHGQALHGEQVAVQGDTGADQNQHGVEDDGILTQFLHHEDEHRHDEREVFSPEQPLAVDVAIEHLVEGQALNEQGVHGPVPAVEAPCSSCTRCSSDRTKALIADNPELAEELEMKIAEAIKGNVEECAE